MRGRCPSPLDDLAGELLVVTAEWTVQVGQHEQLQLVPDLPFLGTSSTS